MRDLPVPARLRDAPALTGVLAVTALGFVARFWALGARTAHWDEGRVGVDVLEFLQTGAYTYDPNVHGPFLFLVNRRVFEFLPATDVTARLVVALVGALVPLAAWLLRDRLDDVEVVTLAALLATNPVLLYYSRFMRNDVLVGGFALFAFAFAVRAIDADEPRYLYGAAAALALAFTTKENALIYLGIWVGALALVFDYRVRVARGDGRPWRAVAGEQFGRAARRARAWESTLLIAAVEFLAIAVFFFAPRPAFGAAFTDPTRIPEVLDAATIGAWESFWGLWVSGGRQDHAYLPFLEEYVEVLVAGALVVSAFAVVGFLADRYGAGGPRPLVSVASYWGGASLVIYPLATDISAAWNAVHTVIPLAIPAAVGIALVYREGVRALSVDDRVSVALAALVLLGAVGQVGWTAATVVYLSPQDPGPMVQYGQPDDDLDPVLNPVSDVVDANDGGTDVMFYGSHFSNPLYRLPIPWYLDAAGANVTHTSSLSELEENAPPVVMVPSNGSAVDGRTAEHVEDRLDGYRALERRAITLETPGSAVWVVVFVEESYLDGDEPLRNGTGAAARDAPSLSATASTAPTAPTASAAPAPSPA